MTIPPPSLKILPEMVQQMAETAWNDPAITELSFKYNKSTGMLKFKTTTKDGEKSTERIQFRLD